MRWLFAVYEKFVVEVGILHMLQVEFTPLEIDEDSMAFGAHEEFGHGGHSLGAVPPTPLTLATHSRRNGA